MRNEETKLSSRILAGFLTMIMVLSLIPFSAIPVFATATGHDDAVTITVTEEDGTTPIAGASVKITVKSTSTEATVIDNVEKTTDANGVVEVMTTSEFNAYFETYEEGDLTVSATVTADDHEAGSLPETVITAVSDNYPVALVSTLITNVTIEGKTLTYQKGVEQELVSVTKIDGDSVTYKVNDGETTTEVPKAEDAGDYQVEVTVSRTGKTDLVSTVNAKINPANIEGISISGRNLAYNGGAQELVELTGSFEEDDIVTWTINTEDTVSKTIPSATAIGVYSIILTVDRGSNYEKLITPAVTTNIIEGELDLDGLTVKGLEGVYTIDNEKNPVAQDVVTVTNKGDYNLQYQLDEGDLAVDDSAWVNEIPTVTNAGSYIVWVKAVKEFYNDQNVAVTPAASAVAPYNVYVAKASQDIAFDNFTGTSGTDQIEGEVPFNKTYDFTATDTEALAGGTVSYDLELDEDGIASIDNDGVLTVNYPGTIKVIATLTGNKNYEADTAEYTLEVSGTVSAQGQYISFKDDEGKIVEEITYVLGTSVPGTTDTISILAAKPNNKRIKGSITHSIDKSPGLTINSNTGAVEVKDYDALAEAIRATTTGTLKLTVTATKSAFDKYGEDTASYIINVKFGEAPETSPFTLPEIDGTNGWYKTKTGVVITPASGYSIAKTASGTFASTVVFDDEGTADRYIYLRNNETSAISDQILVTFKLDTISPAVSDMTIEFSELNLIQKIGSALGFYNPDITITFTAKDFNSGIDHFNWTYTVEDGVSAKNKATTVDQPLKVTYDETTHTATATLTLPADKADQLHGKISFTATDKAGNVSDSKGEEYVFIVDTISPTIKVAYSTYSYKDESTGRTYYGKFAGETQIDGNVGVTFTVEEANFDPDDVVITLTKYDNIDDTTGTDTDISSKVHWPKPGDPDYDVDEHIGTYTITGDGHYVVNFSYHDKSYSEEADENNTITTYTTPAVITIDTTDPVLNIEFIHNGNDQKVKFSVTEHNFLLKKDSISVTGTMKDIQGNNVSYTAVQLTSLLQGADWLAEGNDVYSYTTDQFPNGIYNLAIDYTDIATNVATKFTADEFIIDHSAPTGVKIEIITDPIDTILEVLTFGFYNPEVKVRFTAYDDAAGVQSFTWNYTKEDGASDRNRATDTKETTVAADQDSSDKSKFTAEITLPDTAAKQLRGYLTVFATDVYANSSNKLKDDGNIIVVDSAAPNMKVEYSEASRTVGTTHYYGSDKGGKVDVTIKLDEANFISTIAKYTDKVEVMLSSDGGTTYKRIYPTWTDKDVNTHIGTYTISGDGHYKLAINYSDNAGNPTDVDEGSMYANSDATYKYVSDLITIDTLAPTISVSYDDEKVPVVQTLDDNVRGNEANARKYYADQKVATITIVEHNFEADEVDFTIVAKDISGTVLSSHNGKKPDNDPNLIKFGKWQTNGDTHTITITYPGDANYEFDVAYTDLATNAAADYSTDYFTVDKTAPTNITVDYSTSVLDTVLNSLTFGFYNAKMTVTITADDETSSVRSFMYNYRNAAGVSAVNAELINQALEEANGDITYSADGKTATISFEIPKMVLGNDNQFNGTVDFTATDRADNETKHEETKRVVVDNIAPTAQVAYNESTNKVGDIDYYNGNIDATVTITEANFYSDDVVITVTKDGAAYNVTPTWVDNSVDVHVGRFTLTEDGDYIITINYRDKSSNTMTEYKSNQLTIDTKIEEPTYTINNVARSGDDGKAYKSDATVEFNFEDQNFDTKTITLTRKRYNDETVVYDSEKTGVNDFGVKLNMNDKGGSGTITIPEEVANDGIYTLKITMTDKALHPTESYVKFAITRFGSVYEYNDVLADLIKDGGQYVKSIEKDLIIKEYNAVPITNESLKITITRDGEAIDVDYTSDPTDGKQFETVGIGNSGWYEYVYTIKAANFAEDGVYNITLSSLYDALDASGNSVSTSSTSVPDNSIDADGNKVLDVMKFTVDDTAPEIRNVINLDKEIADRDQIIDGKLTVTYTIIDVGGLKTIEIIVNGSTLDTISEFEDASSYTGTFDLNESSDKQTVQIKVTDLAGNVTDTANDAFKNAHKTSDDPYVFNDTITVSTNFFVRWYANTPLFWGSIGGVVLVAGGSGAAIASKRKKKAKA